MRKVPLYLAIFISQIIMCFGQNNKNYLDCETFQNMERERMRSNKVKTIIGINTMTYNFEEKKHISSNDTAFIKRYDELGNEIESRYWVSGDFYKGENMEYDRYGRLKYRKFIPYKETEHISCVERYYFYVDETTCQLKYSLVYDVTQDGKLTDSIVYSYQNDTVLSQIYGIDENKRWHYKEHEKRIIDEKLGLMKIDITHGMEGGRENEYEFSSGFKMLSHSYKDYNSSGKIKYIYYGDLIIESNHYSANDTLLFSVTKLHYEFY